jgi:signal recognition particle receptor subunit beta
VAVYDSQSKKVVVRVVYDGPGMAGKTTNLEQLCTFFTRQRRSELYTGATAAERTLCLDWLQLDGGLVRGHELRCHLLTVPGQAVLSRRRQMLLSLADATIFVLESTEQGLLEAKPMWQSMLACTGGPAAGVPVVLQANKQDQPGALTPAQIRERWEIDASVPVVAAQAATGQGVRETVVLAIRATAVRLQEELLGNGIGVREGRYETGEELERRILETERQNPMSAVDVVLAAHGLAEAPVPAASPALETPAPDTDVDVASRVVAVSVAEDVTTAAAAPTSVPPSLAPSARPVDEVGEGGKPLGATTVARRDTVPAPATSEASPSSSPRSRGSASESSASESSAPESSAPESPAPESPAPRPLSVRPPRRGRESVRPPVASRLPSLPSGEIPNGLVWPASEGRKTLKRVPVADAVLRSDLMGKRGPDGVVGGAERLVFEAGIWCLKTTRRRRFPDADQARNELVRLAHVKLDLGLLRVPRTVLAVQKDLDGSFWLWTVSLWLATLRSQMSYAVETGDERSLGSVLEQYGRATLQGLRLWLDSGLVLDVSPDHFGALGGEAFYLNDDVGKGSEMPQAGLAILRCFDEYADYSSALETYGASLLKGIESFRPGDLELLDLTRGIETTTVASAAGERAKQQLLSRLTAARRMAL